MSEVSQYHNPEADEIRLEAHDFVAHELGLQSAPVENMAFITPQQAQVFSDFQPGFGGGYNPENDTALVIQQDPSKTGPLTRRVQEGAGGVHEFMHSAGYNEREEGFYGEALAGLGEYKYLEWLQANEKFVPAVDFTLKRAGVELWIPNNWRYVDQTEASSEDPGGARTSQGLIAALGLGYSMRASGVESADILRATKPGGTEHYQRMRQSLDALKPGLSKEVEKFPGYTEGMIQATAIIQDEARKQQIIK